MAKVRFNLKNPTHKETQIFLVYRLPSFKTPFRYFSGERVITRFWSRKKMRVNEVAEYQIFDKINSSLDRLEKNFNEVLTDFHRKDIIPNKGDLKKAVDVIFKNKQHKDDRIDDLVTYMDLFIERRSNSPRYSKSSIKVYRTALGKLKRFLGRKTLAFRDLNLKFYLDFESSLVQQDYNDNYVHKLVSTIRTVVNDAIKNSESTTATTNPYQASALEIKRADSDNIYLTLQELEYLYKFPLTENPRLERVRDLFIVGCFTGLRHSDFSRLESDNLIMLENGARAFEVIAEKTKDRVIIPLHSYVWEILLKYDFQLPTISGQKMNDYLKELGKLVGFSGKFTKRDRRGGGIQRKVYKKYELISTHCARRSFATNSYLEGVPILSIMLLTGHKSTETFKKYIKFDQRENALKMSEHSFFKVAHKF